MIDNTNLTDNTLLWRYMDFSEMMYIVATKSFYLLRPDRYGDPLEGFYPGETTEVFQRRLRRVNTLCWHINDSESDAMWRLYSKNIYNAVAIVIPKGILKELFDDAYSMEVIKYIDYRSELPEMDRTYLYKRKSFKHETELRIVRKSHLEQDASFTLMHPLGDSGLHKLLKRIYIHPEAPERFYIAVKDYFVKQQIECEIIPPNEVGGGIRY